MLQPYGSIPHRVLDTSPLRRSSHRIDRRRSRLPLVPPALATHPTTSKGCHDTDDEPLEGVTEEGRSRGEGGVETAGRSSMLLG